MTAFADGVRVPLVCLLVDPFRLHITVKEDQNTVETFDNRSFLRLAFEKSVQYFLCIIRVQVNRLFVLDRCDPGSACLLCKIQSHHLIVSSPSPYTKQYCSRKEIASALLPQSAGKDTTWFTLTPAGIFLINSAAGLAGRMCFLP